MTQFSRAVRSFLAGLGVVVFCASPAWAQNDPAVAVTGGIDFTNQYNFRGIRQNSEGLAIWPFVDVGIPLGEAATLNVGTWNALLSQLNDNKWYESDLYATLGFSFNNASFSVNYTSYTSPGDYFSHVKELGLRLGFDDSGALGAAALNPYVSVAFELTDDAQADGGASKGTYVELGVAPGYSGSKASLSVPIKVGLSAKDYYEFGSGSDSKFGYFSIGGIVTVPLGGKFDIHGGAELQTFGDTLKAINGFGDGDGSVAGIATIGLGFSF